MPIDTTELEQLMPELAYDAENLGGSIEEEPEIDFERLEAFGIVIAKAKDEAVKHRKNSGIEDSWLYAEEAYIGIDDANRHEFAGARWSKPTSMEGPLSRLPQRDGQRSTVFVPITSRYVDASSAKVCEIALPIDGKSFSAIPTPIPELSALENNENQVISNGIPQFRKPGNNEEPTYELNGEPLVPLTYDDVLRKKVQDATEKVKRAEKRIQDWMVECNFQAEMRKVIHDASRIGVGVIKGPVPIIKKSVVAKATESSLGIEIKQSVQPGSKWVDPWNCFPSPDCGEDIKNGSYFIERDFLSGKQVRELKKEPGYIKEMIDKVLEEGPNKSIQEGKNPSISTVMKQMQFEVWYYTGQVKRSELESAKADLAGVPEDQSVIPAVITLINDSVVKAHVSLFDSGEIPYDALPWRRRAGYWAGVGVAEQIKTSQRMVNAATRRTNDNLGLSSAPQIAINTQAIYPMDGEWVIYPGKMWGIKQDSTIDNVNSAFKTFDIPSKQQELMNVIQYAMKLAEESAGLPLIVQGQTSPTMPTTFGATQIQDNNANTLLRNIGRALDDCITEPHVRRYYEWLLADPEIPEEEKGDMQIDAHGTSALVERYIQDQTLTQLGSLLDNPKLKIDPAKWFNEWCKSKYINPTTIQYTDAEWKELQANEEPTEDPKISIAELNNQTKIAIAQLANQTQQVRIKRDTDRDTAYVRAQEGKVLAEHDARMKELEIKRELAILDYANREKLKLDDVKMQLAKESMRLNVQRELSLADAELKKHEVNNQVAIPSVEPIGRAEPGHAFEQ